MKQILTAATFSQIPSVRHAFFTREWGNAGFSGQENEADAHVAREAMAAQLGVAGGNLLSAYQIHSPDVVVVEDVWAAGDRPRADALVTAKAGIALGILTADCVPVLFAGEGVIGAAHAGWRGAVGGVIENTLSAMERLGAVRSGIHAAIGPCIWQASYEVGAEFPAPFLAENPENARFFKAVSPSEDPLPNPPHKGDGIAAGLLRDASSYSRQQSGHYQFDLPGYVVAKLKALGVASVAVSPADTCAEPERFFSHRYSTLRDEKRGGNIMSAIVMEST